MLTFCLGQPRCVCCDQSSKTHVIYLSTHHSTYCTQHHTHTQHASMHTSSLEPTGHERYAAAMQTPPGHIGLMGLLFPWAGPGGSGVGSGSVSGAVCGGSSKSVKNAAFSGYGGGLSTKLGEWRISMLHVVINNFYVQEDFRTCT